jgi:O-methyltransferase
VKLFHLTFKTFFVQNAKHINMKYLINLFLNYFGYKIVRIENWRTISKFEKLNEPRDLLKIVRNNSMIVNDLRFVNIKESIHYIYKNGIEGAYVECGVWKGGSAAYAAYCLKRLDFFPEIHLFDVFDDICEPDHLVDGDRAIRDVGGLANAQGRLNSIKGVYEHMGGHGNNIYVKNLLTDHLIDYPSDKLKIHKGWFQDTLPEVSLSIGFISILRLDGDWYSSTKVCLENLYQSVVKGGVIIIDDYGCYEGCRKAVDEFLNKINYNPFLVKVDDECVFFIK